MHDKSRILIVVDPLKNAHQPSVVRGAALAKALERGVELLIVHSDREYTSLRVKTPKGWEAARHKIVTNHTNHLEEIASLLRERNFDVLISVSCDWPLDEAIARHALYTNPCLVIKETNYRHKVSRTLFNYADWNLITTCPSPLWLARENDQVNSTAIIACVDPSHPGDHHASLDAKILDTTVELGRKMDLDAHVFHAFLPNYDTSQPDVVAAAPADSAWSFEKNEYQREQLDKLMASYDIAPSNIHTTTGFPENDIPKLERSLGARVVVIGAIARSRLGKVVMGSTAERVLDRLSADILVLKPDGFKTPVNALSYADVKRDPGGHVFQIPAGTRKDWAANRVKEKV